MASSSKSEWLNSCSDQSYGKLVLTLPQILAERNQRPLKTSELMNLRSPWPPQVYDIRKRECLLSKNG